MISRHARVAPAPGHQTPRVWGEVKRDYYVWDLQCFRPHACGERHQEGVSMPKITLFQTPRVWGEA